MNQPSAFLVTLACLTVNPSGTLAVHPNFYDTQFRQSDVNPILANQFNPIVVSHREGHRSIIRFSLKSGFTRSSTLTVT